MASLPIRRDLSVTELRTLACKDDDARVSRRLLALAMALDGVSREAAARQAGMDRQTLRDWVVRYNAEGVVGLRDRERPGRPSLLAPELEEELRQLIEAGPDVERDGVVEYRVKHIQELALRHGLLAQRHAGTVTSDEAVLPQAPADPSQDRSGGPGGV